MNISQIKENKLQMILGFSIPCIIAMLLQTLVTTICVCIVVSVLTFILFTPILNILHSDLDRVSYRLSVRCSEQVKLMQQSTLERSQISSMYFTGIGNAKASAIISSLRGIVLLLMFTLILPVFFGMNGVWMSAPCTEVLTALVSVILLNNKKHFRSGELNGSKGQYDYSECSN